MLQIRIESKRGLSNKLKQRVFHIEIYYLFNDIASTV